MTRRGEAVVRHSKEVIDAILNDWNAGFSASDIARKQIPPMTRSAVIGVVRRSGGSRRKPGERPTIRKTRLKQVKPKAKQPVKALFTVAPEIEPKSPAQTLPKQAEVLLATVGRDLMRLSAGQCQWPVNEAEPGGLHLFCGAPSKPGKSYCEHHHARSFFVLLKPMRRAPRGCN